MKKTIFFWLYFVASIILAVYFSVRIITSIMGRGPVSEVKHISILSDSKNADLEPIRLATGITGGTNIKSADLYQINHRVSKVPGIKKSSVRRLANGDIIIKTEQHKVAAQLSDGVYYYPLSEDGTRIETPSTERDKNTIVFRGTVPENFTEIINVVSGLSEHIDYMYMVESRRWNIYTKNGTLIYLPEDEPATAISKIKRLDNTHKILSRDIEIIDMRDNARILVKTRK
ncbi:MAG: cell division protein FtsQ/DivIB [Alphaproteobacteria bacterium]|nr:cell division protein FtsQ/DivIB [Alphaproteobacteria bacterium]